MMFCYDYWILIVIDILGSEHQEAIFAATEGFKTLINDCIDEGLIKQGVDQVIISNSDDKKSGPTIIEKVCATIESSLDYHYSAVWDMAFQVVSAMFDKLGYYSSYSMKGTLKNLADMQSLPDEDFPYKKQFHECVGSALGSMGPETFLGILPLNLEANDLSDVNVWHFPILKQDIDLQRPICSALREEPDVHGIICSSLRILIQQNKKIKEGKDDLVGADISPAKERAMSHYTPEIAGDNLNFTIGEFASIARENVVRTLFKKTMHRLLKVTQEAGIVEASRNNNSMQVDDSSTESSLSLERARLFDMAVSLLPGLDEPALDVLFSAIKPALQDVDGLIQKKAYKVLSIILRDDSQQRRHEILSSFLTEIILALKEANKKTRNRAYEVLVQIGHEYGDEDDSGQREYLFNMVDIPTRLIGVDIPPTPTSLVARGLAGETPHMISAAVKGLARLAYEFSDLVSSAYKLLPSTFLLLQRKNREIVKANLGLLKVLVAKSKSEGWQAHLTSLVEGLLKWHDDTKNHFKAKVKVLLEMLVRKCGIDAVKAVMPEEHMKLLTNIRKSQAQKERKQAANSGK
ncbi:hypothetical protein CRYUN_Cryun02cG0028800 [Craigia yunnanensis]